MQVSHLRLEIGGFPIHDYRIHEGDLEFRTVKQTNSQRDCAAFSDSSEFNVRVGPQSAMARGREMFVLDAISAIEFGDGELHIDFADGDVERYCIRDGQLEFFTGRSSSPAWYPLSPEEIMQPVVLHTPVATWLHVRLRLMALDVIRPSQRKKGNSHGHGSRLWHGN